MRRIAILGVIALLGGCSDTTAVVPMSGTYDLLSVDGTLDPQGLYPTSKNPEIVGGTLAVGVDTLTVTLSVQSVDSAGEVVGEVIPDEFALAYARQGDRLPFSNAVPGTGGVLLGSGVELAIALPLVSSTGFMATVRSFPFVPSPDRLRRLEQGAM